MLLWHISLQIRGAVCGNIGGQRDRHKIAEQLTVKSLFWSGLCSKYSVFYESLS